MIIAAIIAMVVLFSIAYWIIITPKLNVYEEPLGVSNIFLEENISNFGPYQFPIENKGGGTLKWNIWINTSNLTPGQKSGTINITSNGGSEIRTINLTVLPLNNPTGLPILSTNENGVDITLDNKGLNKGYS